ncbi:MIP transporter [Penicillium malachiteum]|uniref:MIP transporter n=1 Tax=Penicillium malachiteum TaxID=1324776 RepID=A0AAD6MUF8_9EURO|nr:MIP transporter [Penicillium malachiteum]
MVVAYLPQSEKEDHPHMEPAISSFAGRLGGNQDFILDRNDPKNIALLEKVPDAAPCMTFAEIFDLRGFLSPDLWKFAMLECVASLMNVFISSWVTTHPMAATTYPTAGAGIYDTVTFFSPLFGGITNLLLTPLLIYTFGPSSGGHINPTITISCFFARVISFPRAVLYVAGQTLGGALAGFALHTSYGNRDFTVGGCHIDTAYVAPKDGLVIEFMSCLALIFLCFGVALDPRQAKVFGPAVGPWFVGIAVGVICWATAFTREGYIGASLNPARCFGALDHFWLPSRTAWFTSLTHFGPSRGVRRDSPTESLIYRPEAALVVWI